MHHLTVGHVDNVKILGEFLGKLVKICREDVFWFGDLGDDDLFRDSWHHRTGGHLLFCKVLLDLSDLGVIKHWQIQQLFNLMFAIQIEHVNMPLITKLLIRECHRFPLLYY